MKIKITDIKYDVNGEESENSNLPSEFNMDVPSNLSGIEDIISDFISNETGFCVICFSWVNGE